MRVITVKKMLTKPVLSELKQVLTQGGIVVYPTETAYGLGVDATSEKAVQKLLDYKGGRGNNPTSVAVANVEMAKTLVKINSTAKHLYQEFLPGPITVISYSKGKVCPLLESERNALGIRMPDHRIALQLISEFGRPLTATSANTTAQKTPYSVSDLKKYTSEKKLKMIDVFLDVGKLEERPTSTVVDTTLNELEVVRRGAIQLKNATRIKSRSPLETRVVGGEIVNNFVEKLVEKPLIIAIQGELGTGKTELTKGIAQFLGITTPVNSPTYQIMKEYSFQCGKVGGKLVHVDTWRLETPEELIGLNVEKYLCPGSVIVIEWMEKVRDFLEMVKSMAVVVFVTIEGLGEETRNISYEEQ
jgi:L-threonylcarbamoyladenylate synthase